MGLVAQGNGAKVRPFLLRFAEPASAIALPEPREGIRGTKGTHAQFHLYRIDRYRFRSRISYVAALELSSGAVRIPSAG